MSKRTTLTAYGAPSDREKLKQLAQIAGKSESAWIIEKIRHAHEATFGKQEANSK